MRWLTRIALWDLPRVFVDAQEHGPYACWWHEHHFTARGDETMMEDRVYYAPPLGVFGIVGQHLVVAPMLKRIFGFRSLAVRLRFG